MISGKCFTSYKPSIVSNENKARELKMRKSKRARKKSNFGDDFYVYHVN